MKKYEALYRRIKEEIESGILKEGERLFSVREEAKASSLSINTVINAYELLTDEGLIRPRDRGGYYISAGANTLSQRENPSTHIIRHSLAREAGERLEQQYERLLHLDPTFACASPDPEILSGTDLNRLAGTLGTSWVSHGEYQGDYQLRERLSLTNRNYDGPTKAEDLLITNGATEALSLILRTFLQGGDSIALESPVYFNYFRQLSSLGVNIVEIPMTPAGLDLNLLEKELQRRSIKMILCQPNVQNPTGITMTESYRQELLALAQKHNCFLVQDDVFGDLSFAPLRPRNLSSQSSYPKLIQLSSYSKSLAPGLRMGWIRSPRYAKELAEAKLRLTMESSRLTQALLVKYVGTKAHRRHLQKVTTLLKERNQEYLSLLSGILPQGSYIRPPSGGCLLWIEYPQNRDTNELFEKAAGEGLIATPGSMFTTGGDYNNCLRLNTGFKLTDERAKKLRLLG
jgi:DNA-binding transcriptional MocR family regulator